MKNRNHIVATILAGIACFALLPMAQAVVPAPDGGYPGLNTAEGTNALKNLTTGSADTAVGWFSLFSNTDGSLNTGVGAGTLVLNVGNQSTGDGVDNTAVGAVALFLNTTGRDNTAVGTAALLNNDADNNTAVGAFALNANNTGSGNTAIGVEALLDNTIGEENTATGLGALTHNLTGLDNTANGLFALHDNTGGSENVATGVQALAVSQGDDNTATGFQALFFNDSGDANTAVGHGALFANIGGASNTAVGDGALVQNNSGSDNTALGFEAGNTLTTGSGNVFIGSGMIGVAGAEMDHTYIRNINTTTVSGGSSDFVTVDLATGLLGHLSSSRRYKEDIKPMERASEALYRLKPVSYRYKKEIDPTQSPAFGLIAEEVAEVNPDLVARNAEGQAETVHYEMVNAMLLNEFLKEHRKVQELEATVAQQQKSFQSKLAEQDKQIEALASGLQKVSAQVEMSKPAPRVVSTNP
jgi:trimeric autotransporter adhesin